MNTTYGWMYILGFISGVLVGLVLSLILFNV